MVSLGTWPDLSHSLQVFCCRPCQLLIPESPSPTSLQEPVKWSVACQETGPEKLGVDSGPHARRLVAEMKFRILCFGLDRGASGPCPRSQRGAELFTLDRNYFRFSKGTCLYPSWHNALFIWKHFAGSQLGSWTRKFLVLHHYASCKGTCGDICLLILVKRHLPRWCIPGNARTHQSFSNQLVFFPLGNTPICWADQKLPHLGRAMDGKETHAWSWVSVRSCPANTPSPPTFSGKN